MQNKLLNTALTQLGVQEVPRGSNAGPAVEAYLKSVGLGGGYAWCMAFVYWCAKQNNLHAHLVKTGGVLRQWNESTKLRVKTPQPGDIFIMDFGKGVGHTGIVERVVGDVLHTVEGNTNDEGSREGYEVCRRTRKIKDCVGFLRIPQGG